MGKDAKILTSEEVGQRIRMDLEQSRNENKAMLQEARLRFFKRIFENKGKQDN